MLSHQIGIAGGVLLLLGAAFTTRGPAPTKLNILVDGRLPDAGGQLYSAFPRAADFSEPVSTVDWMRCEVEDGMLRISVSLEGQLPAPAACREGDRELAVLFSESPLWQKVLDTRAPLRADSVNVLAAPKRTHIARSLLVEPGPAPAELPAVGGAGLTCDAQSPDGSRVLVFWEAPARATLATCWVEPEAAEPYPLVFNLTPAPQ